MKVKPELRPHVAFIEDGPTPMEKNGVFTVNTIKAKTDLAMNCQSTRSFHRVEYVC